MESTRECYEMAHAGGFFCLEFILGFLTDSENINGKSTCQDNCLHK